jgi:hypothetical protein
MNMKITIPMKERVTMTKRSSHPARRARIATTGLSLSAMLGMISVFGWNAQVAAQTESAQKVEAAKQAKIAAQIAESRAAAKPRVKVVVVTVPAPVQTQRSTQSSGNYSGRNNTSTSTSGVSTSSRTVTTSTRSTQQVTPRVTKPAPIVYTAPVVANPPAQTSQATSGGSTVK